MKNSDTNTLNIQFKSCKPVILFFTILGFLCVLVIHNVEAQILMNGTCTLDQIPGNARTVDVEPGVGTLDLAIEEDAEARSAHDGPTIYILENNATYWTESTITNPDFHLWIRAANGEGHPPIIRPATDEVGESRNPFEQYNDFTAQCIFFNFFDDAGVQAGGPLIQHGDPSRIILDNIWSIGSAGIAVRLNTEGHKLYITDSYFKNGGAPGSGAGRFIDVQGNFQDTIVVENTTHHNFQAHQYRGTSAGINYLRINHVTHIGSLWSYSMGTAKEAYFTNNILMNGSLQGQCDKIDNSAMLAITAYDELAEGTFMGMTDADRTIVVANNNIGYATSDVIDYYETKRNWCLIDEDTWIPPQHIDELAPGDSVPRVPQFPLDSILVAWDEQGVDWLTMENNFQEGLDFTGGLDMEPLIMYMWHRLDGESMPEAPRSHDNYNVRSDDPVTHTYSLEAFRNLAYNDDATSYRAAERGYPVGDLNFFPELKVMWEAGDDAPVSISEDPGTIAKEFRLVGSYPNPFNPTTNVVYELATPVEVTMEVYNVLGQKMQTWYLGMQSAGRHTVTFNADASNLTSGVYIIRMRMGDQVRSHNITLLK